MIWQTLNEEEQNEYTLFKRTTNLMVCSYSNLDGFTEAAATLSAAAHYDLIAHTWCEHNKLYIFDEEGFMTTYTIEAEVGLS